jgi:hypothetical protein
MTDYLYKFRDDGVWLNTDATPEEPFIDVLRVQGLDSAPVRITERDREGMDGGFVDAEFEKMRSIVIEGTIYSPWDAIELFMDDLKANFAPIEDSLPFYLQAPNTGERVLFCKSYGIKYDIDALRRIGQSPFQVTLIAEDPTIYTSEVVSGSAPLSSPVGGRGYDRSYDYGYGDPVIGGNVTIVNVGNRPAPATITFYGPLINPGVVHDESGRRLEFEIELGADQYLVIDLRDRTVRLNGTANRRASMLGTSQWFMLQPGSNSFRFQGEDPITGPPDPLLTVSARGAFR